MPAQYWNYTAGCDMKYYTLSIKSCGTGRKFEPSTSGRKEIL